jgi:hypothetical protein
MRGSPSPKSVDIIKSTPPNISGIKRLCIVVMAFWAVACCAVYGFNLHTAVVVQRELDQTEPCRIHIACSNPYWGIVEQDLKASGMSDAELRRGADAYALTQGKRIEHAQWWMLAAIYSGISGLVVAPIAIVAAVWVWRGFSPISN